MSLRTKQDYFDVAERLGLPKRCPVFEWCERRADTVAVFNELDFEVAKKWVNLKEPIVKRIGESAGRIGGPNYYSCSGLCPEVSLFEQTLALPGYAGYPATRGNYDKDLNPHFELLETGHYTECAEYCGYIESRKMDKHVSSGKSRTPKELLKFVCERIPLMIGELRTRHDNRSTLDVKDEYDVQDLLRGLLQLFFDDVRPEEYTPSYAGKSTRMDFLLKDEATVIEVKMTRNGLGARELGEQLILDIAHYKSHPNCRELYCLVYDPEARIKNPRGIEKDLSESSNELQVYVFIVPRMHE